MARFALGALLVMLASPGLLASARGEDFTLETMPPVVTATEPRAGAAEVDPATTEVRVTFSKAMKDGSWSWSQVSKSSFPDLGGQPAYDESRTTCTLPVRLAPGKTYAIWINTSRFQNFRDVDGRPAVPYLLVFKTRG